MSGPRVLVTGARGFVGEAVVFRLLRDGSFVPVAAVRGATRLSGLCQVVTLALEDASSLPSLEGIQVVVHAAARVHVMSDVAADTLAEYRRVNVEGTVQLALKAASAGVKRFIFISSIKVNGECTAPGRPFNSTAVPTPMDPYGLSKQEAEEALRNIAEDTGMEVVIIRPPMVYGPGVKANFLSMMRWLNKSVPLPLGAIRNQRSLVAIGNLVDLVVTCIDHPAAAGGTFLVSDGADVSTPQLLRSIAQALGKKAWLLPVTDVAAQGGGCLCRKKAMAQRLCESLQVDIGPTRQALGWVPPVSVDDALRQTADYYLDNQNK